MNLTDEPRDQIAGQLCADLADYSSSDLVWNVEVRRSAHGVQNMEVVGQNPRVEQSMRQLNQHVRPVIDVTQQHGLVQKRDSGTSQCSAGLANLIVDLIGMVGVEHDHRWQS